MPPDNDTTSAPRARRWDVTPAEARDIQRELRARLVTHIPLDFTPRLIVGADVAMELNTTRGYAGMVAIDAASMDTVEQAAVEARIDFPYIRCTSRSAIRWTWKLRWRSCCGWQ